jgi:hypothetical protein
MEERKRKNEPEGAWRHSVKRNLKKLVWLLIYTWFKNWHRTGSSGGW